MRPALLTLVLALAAVAAAGCAPPPANRPSFNRLRVGDPAPPLRVARWLNGEPVPRFEPGKVYVLDFWATWCGPCLQAMPHLAALAKEHEAAGLVVIPVTTVAGRNSRDAVTAYVEANGGKFTGLRFAVCDDRRTDADWFEASGQEGIPCAFAVDRRGKVAFIGHPMDLDRVLPGLLAAPSE